MKLFSIESHCLVRCSTLVSAPSREAAEKIAISRPMEDTWRGDSALDSRPSALSCWIMNDAPPPRDPANLKVTEL